jgi:ribosomal protein S18 acetylase RimI-like enzyme
MKNAVLLAGEDDLPEIAELLNDCWREAYGGIIASGYLANMSTERRLAVLRLNRGAGTHDFLTARVGGKLIGAAVCGKSYIEGYPGDGELSALYVREAYIGKGYGRALLAKAEECLAARGYARLVLDVLRDNSRAVGFYLAHGYETGAESSIKLAGQDYPLLIMTKRAA